MNSEKKNCWKREKNKRRTWSRTFLTRKSLIFIKSTIYVTNAENMKNNCKCHYCKKRSCKTGSKTYQRNLNTWNTMLKRKLQFICNESSSRRLKSKSWKLQDKKLRSTTNRWLKIFNLRIKMLKKNTLRKSRNLHKLMITKSKISKKNSTKKFTRPRKNFQLTRRQNNKFRLSCL